VGQFVGPASKADSWRDRGKGGKTGETGEELDLFNNNNNSILTGLTGLADRTRRLIEWLTSGKKRWRCEETRNP
jgi:hypothetical protein